MTNQTALDPEATNAATPAVTPPPFLPLVLLLFMGSGFAALIYEVVWFQLLQLIVGSTALAIGLLLATFMGGMCLGSLWLPRLVPARSHPLRAYACLEIGLAVLGLAVLCVMPLLTRIYAAAGAHGWRGMWLSALIAGLCLLPSTLLMGATLPVAARWVETTRNGVPWLGGFYAGNIVGAVSGCLAAGFYLLRVHDLATATYVAAGANLLVAVVCLGCAAAAPHRIAYTIVRRNMLPSPSGVWRVYVAVAVSGFVALSAEVIWTRLLSLLLGPTVYAFSIILAGFLVGLGIGGGLGSLLTGTGLSSRQALGGCQLLLAGAIYWTVTQVAVSLPYWPISPSLSRSPWYGFQLDLLRCLWALLPPTILWGASFPLALAAVACDRAEAPSRQVGAVYAANTLGAILGALATSLILLPQLGTRAVHQALIGASVFAGILLLGSPRQTFAGATAHTGISPAAWRLWTARPVAAVALIGIGVFVCLRLPSIPHGLIAYGRYFLSHDGRNEFLYVGEGLNASVAVTQSGAGVRYFHVSGKVEASCEPQDMRLQRMLGHLPGLIHPRPRSVLIVGCGAGVTAGAFVPQPEVERIVICELEPLIPRAVAPRFAGANHDVLSDPRTQLVIDDARHYLLSTTETFDVITSDPIHPWVKGAAALYTQEYFELARRHLNPGGCISQWVPLYESSPASVKSEMATFFRVFPQGSIWSNDREGEGYDVVLLGQAGPATIDVQRVQDRMRQHSPLRDSLAEVGFRSVVSLLGTYAGRAGDLEGWLKDAEINRDLSLRLQYRAGLESTLNQGSTIHDQLLHFRRFPSELFSGSSALVNLVRTRMEGLDESTPDDR